jgi:hypothetical protein
MDTLTQIISALYVALGEAAGGPQAMRVANKVLRDAIADNSIDDPGCHQDFVGSCRGRR